MPPKRKRDASPKGLAAGEPLKRNAHAIASSSWGWVGSEVKDISSITDEHLLATCGFSSRNSHRFCRNKFAKLEPPVRMVKEAQKPSVCTNGELEDDIIVISDDEAEEDPTCTKKQCKNNPNCLNYLGQKNWEDEDDAREMFMKLSNLGANPAEDKRKENMPVGLKNLGATCYANASLQVWFRDMAFRSGVYNCQPTEESAEKFKDSPTFQLQVTFAALQNSTQDVFNPTKLVESLELVTTEQQDAQEFSKLFMSHLDAEFKKQSNPALQSLITDQFQGKQVYGTICSKCRSVSARDTDFLEIEINFKNNAKLEDSIAELLQEETLSGDNQYLCSTCESLQDATRYTELASLPPVLHFSLLRFVYDLNTMERRKSKNTISFPKTIDMSRFLGNATDRQSASLHKAQSNIYELRGVLLHKGKSAYHGHYEAQAFDATKGSWYQFNDEIVTEIKRLGDKLDAGKSTVIDVDAVEEDDATQNNARKKQRENARKRQRVEDSDEENFPTALAPTIKISRLAPDSESRISSKDAYMLIYARKEPCPASQEVPVPPPRALAVVEDLNQAHDKACDTYIEKARNAETCFAETRRKVLDIYRTWSVRADDKFVIVSQQALEEFLQSTVIKAAIQMDDQSPPGAQKILLKEILCSHNRYDHHKAACMKRITLEAYNRIRLETNCVLDPDLTSGDICRDCVEETFREKLYAQQHPLQVTELESVCNVDLELGSYWISKPWLKDWKLTRPKMHTIGEEDPSPDFGECQTHVQCEHGGLSLNQTNRCRISIQAFSLLRSLYPSWEPLSGDIEPCMVCDGLLNMGAEDRMEVRRRAEDEKAKLKHMHENALNGNISLLDDVPCALVPIAFLRAWRLWLNRPTENLRPDRIDNSPFMCEHEMLAFDPNCTADMEGLLAVIQRSDWDELERLYPGGPLISVQKASNSRYTHEVAVCTGCRQLRKTNWKSTEITIRMGKKDQERSNTESTGRKTTTYTSAVARQSRRLRSAKENGAKTRMAILKTTTVKEIKVHIQKELNIPTICQRLFYPGDRELDDNTATVASIDIYANAIIELQEETEIHEISDSEEVPKKKRKEEGGGFGGTLLGRTHRASSPLKPEPPAEKVCRACTFSNPPDSLECSMCSGTLV